MWGAYVGCVLNMRGIKPGALGQRGGCQCSAEGHTVVQEALCDATHTAAMHAAPMHAHILQ
jgi:hypothetical protein